MNAELHCGQISMTSGSKKECVQRDVVHRMAPVDGRAIIKCGNSGCIGSCPLSVVEYGYQAGKEPAQLHVDLWEDFPAPEHLWNHESKRLSYQVSKVKCGRLGAKRCVNSLGSLVETVLLAAMGPCAPSEAVPFSSGFVVTSEHAVISGLSAGSFDPVQGISRVDCAVTHGFGGVESMPRAAYMMSTPRKPVFFSSGIEATSEHAGISVFSAESSAPVQSTSCVDGAFSHGIRWNHVWWVLWKSHVSCTPRKVSTRCGDAICTCWLSWSRIGVSRHVH